jgi:hypothetical protein
LVLWEVVDVCGGEGGDDPGVPEFVEHVVGVEGGPDVDDVVIGVVDVEGDCEPGGHVGV